MPDPDPDICEGVDGGGGYCVTGQMDGVTSPVCVCNEGFVAQDGTCACPEGTALQSGTCVGLSYARYTHNHTHITCTFYLTFNKIQQLYVQRFANHTLLYNHTVLF